MRNWVRRALACVVCSVMAVSMFAVPAYRGWLTMEQPDGSTIQVRQVGDEFYHYMVNEAGQRIKQNADGYYVVAGEVPTPEVAEARRAASMARKNIRRAPKEVGTEPNLAPKGVVILVNFKDDAMQSSHTQAVFDELCNSTNCTVNKYNNKNYGSAAQYFADQSNGSYRPQFDVYGPVTLSRNVAYYGTDKDTGDPEEDEGDDQHATDAVVEACILANQQYSSLNFADYDSDGDGYVDFVYVIYAGKGQADGGAATTIWPHNWEIESAISYGYCTYTKAQCQIDGKKLNNYAMSGELSGSSLGGIGTLCHEFGHVMGLPDLYDTKYGTNYDNHVTPGDWNIMDGGSYNGDGHCPPNYDPWQKYFFGWVTPVNLATEGKNITLLPNGTEGYQSYQINSANKLQTATTSGVNYYIENRQKQGWDAFIPTSGMLVWKINFNASAWSSNAPNNTAGSPKYTIVPADGKTSDYGAAGDTYPTSTVRSYTPISGHALTEITKSGNNITFKYNGGQQKTECTYELLGEHCTYPADGKVAYNTALSLTITPATGYTLADPSCWTVEMGTNNDLVYGEGFTYNAGTNEFRIEHVTDDVAIIVEGKEQVTLTWMSNGSQFAQTITAGSVVLPENEPEGCDGKVFVGWTKTANYESESTAPEIIKNGDAADKGNVFYAVFATKGEGGGSANTTYTFNSKSWGDATDSWSSDKDGVQLMSGQGVQVTTGASGAGATTKSSVVNVSKVVVSFCTNKSSGAGSIDITVGSTKVSKSVTSSGGTSLRNLEYSFENISGKVSIVANCTTNSVYVNAITITTAGGSSYTDYTTSCGTPAEKYAINITTHAHGSLTTSPSNEAAAGKTVTITATADTHYHLATLTVKDASNADVPVSGEGNTRTFTMPEKAVTISATFEEDTKYTINFYVNGAIQKTESLFAGQTATPPSVDAPCEAYNYAGGWVTSAITEETTSAPTYVTSFTVSGAQNYYAVFSRVEEGEGGGSSSSTFETKNQGYSNGEEGGTKVIDGVTYTFAKGTNTTNSPKYYTSSECVHLYPSNTLTISAESNITSIEYTFSRNDGWTAYPGTWNSTTSKWTGEANSITFTVSSATGYQVRISKIVATVGSAPASTTYYTTNCTTPTEVTVTFYANGGEGEMSDQVIPYNVATALNTCTFTRTGYTFAGWATSATGEKVYDDEAKVILTKNTTLYAKWAKKSYDIIINQPEKGTIATSPENTAEFESAVTITFEPNSGYKLSELIVKDASDANVPVSGEGNTRTFTMPASNVTISATVTVIPEYTISFYNNALLLESEKVLEGGTATAPSSNPVACDGYTFTGWVTENNLADDNTDDPIYATEFTATQDQNYYAVFSRTEGGGEEPVNTTYTFNSMNWGDETNSWSKDKDGNSYNNDNQGVQVTAGSSGAGATTKSSVANVSKVVVRYCTNKSSGEGSIDITVGSTEKSLDVSSTGGTTLRNLEYTFDKVSGKVSIKVNCTTNSIYVNSITITTGGSSSTTYYTTQPNCVECTNKVTIIKGTSDNGSFTVTEGVFENCKNSGVVVNITDITPNEDYQFKAITQTGISEGVTIDQEAKTVSYAKDISGTSTINVIFEHKPVYTITFVNNGTPYVEENVTAGKTVNLPTDPTVSCEGYTFVGWWGEELNPATTEAQKWITSGFEAKNDTTYYAIYKEIVAGSGESEVASVTFKTNSSDDSNERASDEDIKKFLIESNTGVASFSGSKTYLGVNGLKLGSGSSAGYITLTLNATASIKKVIVNGVKYSSDGGELKVEVGDEDLGSKSPAANLEYVAETPVETDEITVSTTSKRAYVSSIRVIAGGGSTTYYSSTVSCGGGTAVENTSAEQVAVKALMNGQIVIIRDDAIYSITGVRIQ